MLFQQGSYIQFYPLNINPKKVHMHGNNKSLEELEMCVGSEIGSIILDNRFEAKRVADICKRLGKKIKTKYRYRCSHS